MFGPPNQYEEFYSSSLGLCKEQNITTSGCQNRTYEIPKNGDSAIGCEADSEYFGCKDWFINNSRAFVDPQNFEDYMKSLILANMTFAGIQEVIYYPENSTGVAYFYMRDQNKAPWLFYSKGDKFRIYPNKTSDILDDLKHVTCDFESNFPDGGRCVCSFDPVRSRVCSMNYSYSIDAQTKNDILVYLSSINIRQLNNLSVRGDCVLFSLNNFDDMVCFNTDDLITHAKWGKSIREDRNWQDEEYDITLQ